MFRLSEKQKKKSHPLFSLSLSFHFKNQNQNQVRPFALLPRGRAHRLPGRPPRLAHPAHRPDQPHRGPRGAPPHRAELWRLWPRPRRLCRRRRARRGRQRGAQAPPEGDRARLPGQAHAQAARGLRQQQGLLLGERARRPDGRRPAHHRGRREVLRLRVGALLVHVQAAARRRAVHAVAGADHGLQGPAGAVRLLLPVGRGAAAPEPAARGDDGAGGGAVGRVSRGARAARGLGRGGRVQRPAVGGQRADDLGPAPVAAAQAREAERVPEVCAAAGGKGRGEVFVWLLRAEKREASGKKFFFFFLGKEENLTLFPSFLSLKPNPTPTKIVKKNNNNNARTGTL